MPPNERAYWLDGLRLLAAFAVLLQHYVQRSFQDEAQWFLQLGPGVFGVALFFMISGYVIPFSVKNRFSLREFVLKRTFRIWPMYLVTLVLISLLGLGGVAPFDKIQDMNALEVFFNVILIFEYTGSPALLSVAWSLSLEIVWYVFFCLCLWQFHMRHAVWISLALSGGLLIAAALSITLDVRLPFGRLSMLNAALLGYAAYSYHQGRVLRRAMIIAMGGFLVSTWTTQWVAFGYFRHENISLISGLSAWSMAFAVFILVCLIPRMRSLAIWRHPLLLYFSAASYSIYLLHEPVSFILQSWLSGWPLVLTASALTCAASSLCFKYIETPANTFGRRLANGLFNHNPRVRFGD